MTTPDWMGVGKDVIVAVATISGIVAGLRGLNAWKRQLADASGLDIRYVGSIERRQRKPSFGAIQGIASVFCMKTSELLRKAKL
jgi:hypothetical protein